MEEGGAMSDLLQEQLAGPRPISVDIATDDVRLLYACQTDPAQYMQLILAKLKDAGCPGVEGSLRLRLTHGQVYKVKDSVLEERASFTYLWLPPAYVAGLSPEMQRGALA